MILKASFIIPVYNAENSIVRCINSILNQTYSNFEVIAVDDGSSDKTGDILDQIALRDTRIKVYHVENKGVSAARNFALKKVTGDVVLFIDADDLILKEYLEKMIEILQKKNTNVAICNYKEIDCNNIVETWESEYSESYVIDVEKEYDFMEDYAHYMVWAAIFKKEILKGLTFDTDLYVAEDSLFFAKVLKRCKKIAVVDNEWYGYVIYPVSACHGEFDEKKYTEIIAWKRIVNLFLEKNSVAYISSRTALALRCYLIIRKACIVQPRRLKMENSILVEARKNWEYFMKSRFSYKIKLNYTLWCIFPRLFCSHIERKSKL